MVDIARKVIQTNLIMLLKLCSALFRGLIPRQNIKLIIHLPPPIFPIALIPCSSLFINPTHGAQTIEVYW